MTAATFLLILTAYLIGSIPAGVLVARLYGAPDPRTMGSGNIGATNVGRTAGKGAGIATLIIDILKGAVPVIIAEYFFGGSVIIISLTAFAAFFGHIFPIFLGFKGGKGVATALGIYLSISPLQAIISLIIFILIVFVTRYVSLGSMTSSFAIIIIFLLSPSLKQYVLLSIGICLFIIISHRENIKRLLNGTENKIGQKI
ncbi:MAG: glycerol-3-phosphate 1-O-acyltransferase PlsY [Deltaproteobacteria bacterium]|nr:glycerol-3-phosphate 1-O-acyltransferase PlsY [Deltaproteobacteria bacterium]